MSAYSAGSLGFDGLMIIKPHMAVLIPILFLRKRAWTAIASAAATVAALVWQQAARSPDRTALVCGSQALSFAQLAEQGLRAHGIGAVSAAPWGSPGVLPIPFAYVLMMGAEGLTLATQVAGEGVRTFVPE